MFNSGRVGSNGEGSADPRLVSVVAVWPVPLKYWSENPNWEPEYIPDETGELAQVNPSYTPEEPKYINDFVQLVERRPDCKAAKILADGTWLDVTTQEEVREEEILAQVLLLKEEYEATCNAPVLFNGVTYKGGESSAGGIANAVSIAQGCNEATVWITDIDKVKREMTHAEAMTVAVVIGKVPRDAFLVRADALVEMNS